MNVEWTSALNQLRRHPFFTLSAALSLALGMSLATAVFSMVDALFFHPLPFAHQERLVRVYEAKPGIPTPSSAISARHFLAARDYAKSLDMVAATTFDYQSVAVGQSGEATRVPVAQVTANYFEILGTHPLHGRSFVEADANAEQGQPVVISYALWQSRFGGQLDAIGGTIPIDGVQRIIIGVMAAGFNYPNNTRIWMPLSERALRLAATSDRRGGLYAVTGRLTPGATTDGADAELSAIYQRADADAGIKDPPRAQLVSLATDATAAYRDQIRLWMAVAIVIMLLCAVNFATMCLASGMRRRSEIAVRSAMGATVRHVVTLLMSEATLIAAVGGILAVMLAAWLLGARNLLFEDGALPVTPTIGWTTVAFGILVTTIIGSIFAVAPAVELSNADLRPLLSGGGPTMTGGSREQRGRRGLVALQLALALACVGTVTALVQSERRHQERGPGYNYASMVTASLLIPDSAARLGMETSLLNYVRAIPGVSAAAVVRSPEYGAWMTGDVDSRHEGFQFLRDVSADYFATLGLRPTMGRLPTASEIATRAPVVVLSQSNKRWNFGSGEAIGHRLAIRRDGSSEKSWYTVIGVVPDARQGPYFLPLGTPVYTTQSLPLDRSATQVLIRVSGNAQLHLKPVRDAMGQFDSRILVSDLRTVQSEVDIWAAQSRGRTAFFLFVALLALLLAVIGVYGLTSYAAERRAHEVGIRIALGATPLRLIRTLLDDLGRVAIVGVPGGVLLTAGVVRVLDVALSEPLRDNVRVSLPVAPFVVTILALALIACAGTFIPLWRALHQDVVRTLHGT